MTTDSLFMVADVEVAAEAYLDESARRYNAALEPDPQEQMHAALAAVEPLIRERLAQEVEADLNANADFLTPSCRLGYRTAARIVRGDAS